MADEPKVPAGWVDTPWDGSAAQYKDAAAYADACLINLNTGPREQWTKDMAMLPYKEPGGQINGRGVMACAGGRGLSRVQKPASVSAEKWAGAKKAAAVKLIKLYGQMGRTAPEMVYRMAGQAMPK